MDHHPTISVGWIGIDINTITLRNQQIPQSRTRADMAWEEGNVRSFVASVITIYLTMKSSDTPQTDSSSSLVWFTKASVNANQSTHDEVARWLATILIINDAAFVHATEYPDPNSASRNSLLVALAPAILEQETGIAPAIYFQKQTGYFDR